jgi:hypothetical protein
MPVSAVQPRRILALKVRGEVSTAIERRQIAVKASTGRRHRIMALAPDRRLIGVRRRAIGDMAPHPVTAVGLRITGPILLLIQRRVTRPRALRVFLRRARSRLHITPAEAAILASQEEDTRVEAGDTPAEADDAGD